MAGYEQVWSRLSGVTPSQRPSCLPPGAVNFPITLRELLLVGISSQSAHHENAEIREPHYMRAKFRQ
jgi:hypothetical protein